MYFRNRANVNVEALVDTANRTIGVDIDHDNIHIGKDFSSYINFGSIAAGASVNILIVTPSDKEIHWRPSNPKPTADKLRILLFEGATVTAGNEGSPMPKINRQRILKTASGLGLYSAPTIGADGTQIDGDFLPGSTGVGGTREGSELSERSELVLDKSTKYILRYTNESSSASILNVRFNWYEV